ncbi:MAG: EAL domain-containing protein [Sulfuricella sp.]|nr:EAL domain-containing protein [Sulfuricella sp.]
MIKRFIASPLRFKLILASVAVEVLMLTLLVANSVRLIENSMKEMTALRLNEVSALLNSSLAGPLAQGDFATLQEVLQEIRRKEGITYLILYNDAGKVVASSALHSALSPVSNHKAVGASDSSHFDTEIPITLAGHAYGLLRFGISTEFMAQAKMHLLEQSLLIALAEILLTVLMLAALGYWLTRHLAKLTRGAEAVAAGNFDFSLPVGSRDEIGRLTGAFNTMAENVRGRIAQLQAAEEKQRSYLTLAEQEHARLVSLLSAMNLGILFVSSDNKVIYHNPAFRRIWMFPEELDLIGRPVGEVLECSANQLSKPDHFSKHLLQVLETHEVSDSFEIPMADGRVVTQLSYAVRNHEGHYIGHLWVYEDVTRERQTAEQLVYLAERDFLTGLYNRHRFQEELSRFIADIERRKSLGALLFFDLDEFKYINDTFGHRAGDAMLIRISGEVGALVRRNEIFCRLGGDEFAILVPDVTEQETLALAERVVRAIGQIPFRYEGQNLRLTSSLGIALFPLHAANAEELVAHADTAMYQAKEAGKNAWRLYRQDLDFSRTMVNRMSWNERIDHALEHGLLRLHFQGIYHAGDGALAHLEVLVRMADDAHPGQVIMPGHFIPHAEKSGKIVEIDRWVIRESIRLLAGSAGMPALAVNISGRSFGDPLLPQYIDEQLSQAGVEPRRLLVELTETSAVSDLHDAQRFIEALRQTGCTVCLDDFGTGFSSFAYLKHLDADILKIDGLFVNNLPNDRDNQLFVKAIVDVARGMHKLTVAEFVEDEKTLEMLKRFGVDMVQGYHLDKPCAAHPALADPVGQAFSPV